MPKSRTNAMNASCEAPRHRAERLAGATSAGIAALPAEQLRALVHELQARRTELEIENEALRAAKSESAETRDNRLDLSAMKRLAELSAEFAREGDLKSALTAVVDAAIAITGADFGNIQLLDPASGDLKIAAQRGFPKWWLKFWDRASAGQGTCGTALARGERVIVEDVEQCEIFIGTPALEIQRRAGVRAVQSTPLVSRSGRLIGMFSTHFRAPRRPDERTLTLLDLLARQAADLIDRAQADAVLRQNEAQARAMLENAPFEFWVRDAQGRCILLNAAAVRHWGDGTGKLMEESNVPDHVLAIWKANNRRAFAGEVVEGEVEFICDGQRRVYHNVVAPFRVENDIRGILGFNLDITDRKRAEEELQAAKETLEQRVAERTNALQMLHDVASMANQAQNTEQAIEYCLERTAMYNGWCFGQSLLPSADDPDLLLPGYAWYADDRQRFRPFREATIGLRIRRGQGLPGRVFASGNLEWTTDLQSDLLAHRAVLARELGIATAVALPVPVGDKVAAVLEFFSDRVHQPNNRIADAMAGVGLQLGRVIERAKFEEHLLTIAEEVQRGIAQDLHDDVGQELTGLDLKMETLAELLASSATPAGKLAQNLTATVQTIRSKVRAISHGLLPAELEEGRLEDGLRKLVAVTDAGSRIRCTFICSHPGAVFDGRVALHLYRIAQEAIANAVRHSGARHIRVTLKKHRGKTALRIHDDGQGIPDANRPAGGMGLRTMRYRAGLIGARLEAGPGRKGGTEVVCYVPSLDDDARDASRAWRS